MKWPWVSRARLDMALHNLLEMDALYRADVRYYRTALAEERQAHATTRAQYHAIAMPKAPVPAPVEPIPEPDVPPDVVLAAMQQISPVPDKTYEANWQHWERNKAKAKAHPEAFAREILEGAVFEPPIEPPSVTFMVVPSRTVIE